MAQIQGQPAAAESRTSTQPYGGERYNYHARAAPGEQQPLPSQARTGEEHDAARYSGQDNLHYQHFYGQDGGRAGQHNGKTDAAPYPHGSDARESRRPPPFSQLPLPFSPIAPIGEDSMQLHDRSCLQEEMPSQIFELHGCQQLHDEPAHHHHHDAAQASLGRRRHSAENNRAPAARCQSAHSGDSFQPQDKSRAKSHANIRTHGEQ